MSFCNKQMKKFSFIAIIKQNDNIQNIISVPTAVQSIVVHSPIITTCINHHKFYCFSDLN